MHTPLAETEVARFHSDGYVVCPELLAAVDHNALEGMVDEIAAWPATTDRWQHYREQTVDGPVLTRTENFLPDHEGLRRFLTEGRVVAAVSQLFGEPAVVFKEKINYKLPGGGGFAPHQDAQAYAYGTSHITCLVAIDENRRDNGCLWFSPGNHQRGLLETDDSGCLSENVVAALPWAAATVPRGGAVFFSSLVPHRSSANDSQAARRSLYVTYSRGSEGDLRQAYYDDRQRAMSQQRIAGDAPPRISTIGHFRGKGVS